MSENNSIPVSYDDILPVITEQLSAGGTVRIKPRGSSMLPLIKQGRDEVVLTAYKGNAKKYDILFYRRENGQFVLHRLVKKRHGQYYIRGDHQFEYEVGITDKNIIGTVKGIYRSGKYIPYGSISFYYWAVIGTFRFRMKSRIRKILKRG